MNRPNLEEIKQSILSGKGGKCYHTNVFVKFFLEALGYDIQFLSSVINECSVDNHIITIITSLKTPGDKYLVDVGTGFPTFEPIPLDFDEESPVYTQSFLKYKYVRNSKDGRLARYHSRTLGPTSLKKEERGTEWRKFYSFNLTPRDFSSFDETMGKIYTDLNSEITPYHNSIRAVRFSEPGMKLVALKNSSLLLENEENFLEETKLKSVEEVLESVSRYFPLLQEDAKKAVKYIKFDF